MGKQNKFGSRFTEKRAVWNTSVADYFIPNAECNTKHKRSKSESCHLSSRPKKEVVIDTPQQPDCFDAATLVDSVDAQKPPMQKAQSLISAGITKAKETKAKEIKAKEIKTKEPCLRRFSEPVSNDSAIAENEIEEDPMEVFRRNRKLIPETVTIDTLLLPSPVSADDIVPSVWIPSKRNGKYGRKSVRAGGSKSCGVYSPLASHFESAMTLESKSCVSIPINPVKRSIATAPKPESQTSSVESVSFESSQQQAAKSLAKAKRKAQFRADRAQFELSDLSIMV